jgi:hypothetical protein
MKDLAQMVENINLQFGAFGIRGIDLPVPGKKRKLDVFPHISRHLNHLS